MQLVAWKVFQSVFVCVLYVLPSPHTFTSLPPNTVCLLTASQSRDPVFEAVFRHLAHRPSFFVTYTSATSKFRRYTCKYDTATTSFHILANSAVGSGRLFYAVLSIQLKQHPEINQITYLLLSHLLEAATRISLKYVSVYVSI
jgi:hypothetical protein